MKRILLTALKLVNYWTNNEITAKEEAQQILKYLVLKNDTARSIEVYEELELAMELEMDKRDREALKTSKLIQSKFGRKSRVIDPNFELPLNKIEVEFEKVI